MDSYKTCIENDYMQAKLSLPLHIFFEGITSPYHDISYDKEAGITTFKQRYRGDKVKVDQDKVKALQVSDPIAYELFTQRLSFQDVLNWVSDSAMRKETIRSSIDNFVRITGANYMFDPDVLGLQLALKKHNRVHKRIAAKERLQNMLDDYQDENGKVWVQVEQTDCDLATWSSIYDIDATIEAYEGLQQSIYDSAEGSCYFTFVDPEDVPEWKSYSYDNVMMDYENGGNGYSIQLHRGAY